MKKLTLAVIGIVLCGSLGYVAVRAIATDQIFRREGPSASPASGLGRTSAPTDKALPTATTAPPSGASGMSASTASGVVPTTSTSTGSLPLTGSPNNVAAADVGGHVEQLTGAYGPGFFGSRLVDGLAEPVWKATEPVTFPQETVFAFSQGETPLIRSVLETANDLRPLGNGSVILITDGEEGCHGDPRKAADELKASGIDVTLNIVGFTLTGEKVESELGTPARTTGGRYYGAQNGDELTRALMVAAAQSLPYDVYDSSGRLVGTGDTSALGNELSPGAYRVVVHALGQELEEPVNIAADRNVVLTVAQSGDRFVINR